MTSQPATGLPPGAQSAARDRPTRDVAGNSAGTAQVPATPPASTAPQLGSAPQSTASATTPPASRSLPATAPSSTTPPASPAGSLPSAAPSSATPPATTPLAGDIPAERHQLPRRVTRYWRWRVFFGALPLLLLLASLAIVIPWGPWWVRWGIVGIVFALIVVGMILAPPIRYRVFWYAISPTEIDIQHGIIFIKRSVVPMHRVQNLRTERGPMADHYQMTNLKIRTAAGSVTISGLDRAEANELCERISRLSDVADDV